MATRPLIKESLILLRACGLDLHKCSGLSNVRLALSVSLILAACINALLECIFNWQGLHSMESLTVFVGLYQLLIKIHTLVIHRKNLAKVIKMMENFWHGSKYSSELRNEIETIFAIVRKSMKFVTMFLIFGVSAYITQAVFATSRKLPLKSYYPTDLRRSPDHEIAFALQLLSVFIGSLVLLGFDFLFISLIINISCELKIVKKAFQNIPIASESRSVTKKSLEEVYKIIEHHNLTLECIKGVREIYSFLLLNVYFYDMVCMCVGLLSIIDTGFPPNLQSLFTNGVYVSFYVIQLFVYCATGNYLITQSENVSAAAYNTDWWVKTQPELRRAFVLVIQRANKAENLTAGGMFALNLSSFRKVIRAALSFFTLVEAICKDG